MSQLRPSLSQTSSDESRVEERQIVANFYELGLLADRKRRGEPKAKSHRRTVDRSYSNGPSLSRSSSVPSHPSTTSGHSRGKRPGILGIGSLSHNHHHRSRSRDENHPRPKTPVHPPLASRPSNPAKPALSRPGASTRPTNTLTKSRENLDPNAPRRPIIRFASAGDRTRLQADGYDPQDHFDRIARAVRPAYNSKAATSFNWRAGQSMAGMLDGERSRNRRERTFIGSQCAVCDEPLEHTLRGERILQFSCGHVSHEACFYEYIKEVESQHCPTCNAALGLDTSRGGNILDLEKLSSIVRSVSSAEPREQRQAQAVPESPTEPQHPSNRSRYASGEMSEGRNSQPPPPAGQRHKRNDSAVSAGVSSGDEAYGPTSSRKHDYDVHSMETNISARNSIAKNPIPSPNVTIRSEFPTLTRSRVQQTLTCLITVEVPEGKWIPDPSDIRGVSPTHNRQTSAPSAEETQANTGAPNTPQPDHEPFVPYDSPEVLEDITEDLRLRVDNWHGLDFQRFGKLRLFNTIRVGKDRQSWQELECFLFAEMLICVKEKKNAAPHWDGSSQRKLTRCTLKGSILIKKHLKQVTEAGGDDNVLTLSLSVAELPAFHLEFPDQTQLQHWKRALLDLNSAVEAQAPIKSPSPEQADVTDSDDEDYRTLKTTRRASAASSWGQPKSTTTAPTEYTSAGKGNQTAPPTLTSFHVPLDIVVVIPVSSSMQGLKITLLRDALKFLVQNLGEKDRMGLVTFGSGAGGVPLVGMTSKGWNGWGNALASIRPVGQKSLRADVVEGANVAMDLLMQRKNSNPIGTILLISDSSTADVESVDFVISRAEAAKIAIHSFGLGMTHKPDTMIELSTRTKASYTYVKDWMMLRECVAGVIGSMQTLSHQNVKLKLKLPEGSPAKFVKISGALQITKRATGKDAEAALGDLRFGDKRDVLVQLVIAPDTSSQENLPQDPWESIVSGLEALGGPLDSEDNRGVSVEEVPLIQADLTYGDILREGTLQHLPRPSLLAITMLAPNGKPKSSGRPSTPPIPPHPSIVQRRMELLTSDMLTRALTLISRNQHERAHHLLHETRSILKGLGKGGLPPIPAPTSAPAPKHTANGPTSNPVSIPLSSPEKNGSTGVSASSSVGSASPPPGSPERRRTPSPSLVGDRTTFAPASGIDAVTMAALDLELESALEWINHPAVFGRDSRKAVLQAIGVISSQRAYTFRTPSESLWAGRVAGIKRLTSRSRDWREADESLMEEN